VLAGLGLILGFVDLARGGTAIASLLLSVTYCALIPLAIWRGGSREAHDTDDTTRPEYGAAAIVALCVLALYLLTMPPSTATWDTREYIAAAY